MSETLALEAQSWLACINAGDLKADHVTDVLNLVAACHTRMLELSNCNQSSAIKLAIAGANLLLAIRNQNPSENILPDWALVHEEQFCRYGGIWIHSQAEANADLSTSLTEQGLHLLKRLKQFHQESIPWIDVFYSDLKSHINKRSATTDQHHHLVVVGNCQAHPLMLGLREALPEAFISSCPSVHLATPDDVARLHKSLARTDVLVMHRIQSGYRNNIGLDSQTLRDLLPTSGEAVILPNLHYEGHHPWIGYAKDPGNLLGSIREESPLGDYHDFLAMVAASQLIDLEELLVPSCPATVKPLLLEAHELSLDELSRRETDCDIHISDWICREYRERPLMHTINHPTHALLYELLRRLLCRLERLDPIDPEQLDAHEHLGALTIPIHPWVGDALGLGAWHSSWGQKGGCTFGIKNQLQASMDFYRRNPFILEANSCHPKAQFATRLLEAIDRSHLHWLGQKQADQARPPATEIPYRFIDPLHDFHSWEDEQVPRTPSPDWDQPLHSYRIGWRVEREALVLPVGVVTEDGWLSDCLQYLPPQWQQTDWMHSLAGYELLSEKDMATLIPPKVENERHLLGRWCVLNDIVAHRNLGHFFHDLLPQLIAIRRLKQEWPDLQVLGNTERYSNLRILRELVLDDDLHPRPPETQLRVQELFIQPLAFNGGVGFLAKPETDWWFAIEDFREGLQLLRQKLMPDPSGSWHGHWVCFSRDLHAPTEAPQGRVFSNYPQLIERLSNAGVLVVDPGHHDIRQLQTLVAGARGFVGIHGAGLFNALLGKPGARVVEIRPACGCWRALELTCRIADLDWKQVNCEKDSGNPIHSWIPIEDVMSLLN